MAYYDALIAKWPSVQGADTSARLDALNAETVAGPRKPVPIADVMTYLRTNNLWLQIKAATATSPGAAAAVDLNADMRMQTIDFDLAIVQQMLADLVGRALLTQTQSDALNAMANTTVTWRQANGYAQPVTDMDLVNAGIITMTKVP